MTGVDVADHGGAVVVVELNRLQQQPSGQEGEQPEPNIHRGLLSLLYRQPFGPAHVFVTEWCQWTARSSHAGGTMGEASRCTEA